jgi:addiction module HigA family antidote
MLSKSKLLTTTRERRRAKLEPITPGEILLEEFMKPLSISQNRLARDLDVPPVRINAIVHARRAITPDTALRLAQYFGVSPEFWINLQAHYELKVAKRAFGPSIRKRVRRIRAA